MKRFSEEEVAIGIIGVAAVVLVVVIGSGFNDAEHEVGEGVGLGLFTAIVGAALFLL